jgi:hypothetical protein
MIGLVIIMYTIAAAVNLGSIIEQEACQYTFLGGWRCSIDVYKLIQVDQSEAEVGKRSPASRPEAAGK